MLGTFVEHEAPRTAGSGSCGRIRLFELLDKLIAAFALGKRRPARSEAEAWVPAALPGIAMARHPRPPPLPHASSAPRLGQAKLSAWPLCRVAMSRRCCTARRDGTRTA